VARIKYTALVESIRGTIGGTTFQRNAYGFTVKSKPNMVNPNSSRQGERKRGFQRALQSWRGLTDSNRANWETYASTYPTPTRNNPAAYLNGFNLFVRWTVASLQGPGSMLADPSGAQGVISFSEVALQLSGGVFTIEVDFTKTNGPWFVLLYLTRPLAPTQRFQKSWTRYIAYVYNTTPISSPITGNYSSVYGFVPSVGDLIGVDITFVNISNGQVIYIPTQITTVTT
jgi:hypothetical protein